jgi:hypothetical protein
VNKSLTSFHASSTGGGEATTHWRHWYARRHPRFPVYGCPRPAHVPTHTGLLGSNAELVRLTRMRRCTSGVSCRSAAAAPMPPASPAVLSPVAGLAASTASTAPVSSTASRETRAWYLSILICVVRACESHYDHTNL